MEMYKVTSDCGLTVSRPRLHELIDDLGSTLLEVIEAPGPLDTEVTGVTIFDPNDDLLVSPGELLLGVGVAAQPAIDALLRRLAVVRAAALVIKTPEQAGDSLRQAARAHGVPLLGLSRAASWFHVAVLLRKLVDRRVLGTEYLGGRPAGDLFAFANAVSALVDAPVTVEDRSSRVLAFSGRQDEADVGRVETVLGRHVPQRYSQALEELGVFRELYRSDRPVYVPSLDSSMLPRVAVAVRAGAEVLGSIWAAVREPLSEERMQAFTEAAGLAALHMLHERHAGDPGRQLSADLVGAMLGGGQEAAEAAARLGLPRAGLCVLACQPVGVQGVAYESASQRLGDALALHLSAIHTGAAVGRIGRLVYAVLPAQGDPDEAGRRVHAIASSFVARVGSREQIVIGIGGPVPSLAGLAGARTEAERAVRVLCDTRREGCAARFEDVYLETVLNRVGDMLGSDGDRPRGPVARLLDYDEQNAAALTASLRAYLEAFGNVGQAAEAVHVHPNTFRYRLRRIREVSQLDLEDPRARLATLMQLTTLQYS
jgi:hypothetical protein